MQVSVENDGLQRRMTVELAPEQLDKAMQSRLQNLARTVKMPGFRPGKVPMRIVKQRYGEQVQIEAMQEAVQNSLFEALNQENLHPVATPQVELAPLEEGKAPAYTATFEVYPAIELAPLDGIKVTRPVAEIAEADIDHMIDTIREQRKTWANVERAARQGDRVIVDFVGTRDGVEFEGGSAKGVPAVIGEHKFIKDFEDNLLGIVAGEEKTFDASFPEDYGNAELAGKSVTFKVTAQAVAEAVLPEVDDQFAASFGVGDGGVAAMREEVKSNMERELAQTVKQRVKAQIVEALLEKNGGFDIPGALLDSERKNLARQLQQSTGQELPQENLSILDAETSRRVRLGLIMAEVIEQQDIKVSADKVRAAIEEVASTYEHPEEIVSWYFADKKRLAEVENSVLEDQVIDWVAGQIEVSDEKKTFFEIMNPA